MARYLNPAKIGLLVLAELYAEDAVPSGAILPVLSFIATHTIDQYASETGSSRSNHWKPAEKAVSLIISIKDFERLLGGHACLRGMPGRRLWDQFLDKIWGINSLDELHQFFYRMQGIISKTKEQRKRETGLSSPEPEEGIKFSRNSPLGAFVRRAEVEFVRLRFHDCAELWKDFVRYRQPTAQQWKRKTPRLTFDNVLLSGEQDVWDTGTASTLASVIYGDMLTGDESSTLPVSTDDVQALLEFQIAHLQKYGSRVPNEIRHQFQDLISDSFVIPSTTHYLSFLEAWRSGDYPSAFDELHRYFDYSTHNKERHAFYQHALMNLAVIQADFGHHKEAVEAMLETVSTARENKDVHCLNFALNWLYQFGLNHPDLVQDLESNSMLGSSKESLAFLRVKAMETGMHSLWSQVLLSEAKAGLFNGDSVATAFENIVRSSQLILQHNMKRMFGHQLSLAMALWDRLGVAQLSTITADVFLRCHSRHGMIDDELRAKCQLALRLTGRGKYQEALQMMESVDGEALRSRRSGQDWFRYRGLIKLSRDLRHGFLDGAEELLDQLLQPTDAGTESDLSLNIDNLHIEYLIRRGNLQAAFEKVESLLAQCHDEKKGIAVRVRLLLMKTNLLDKCGRPQRGFSIAMRAASIAWRARLMNSLWPAIGAVANILTSMSEFGASSQLLTTILPRAIETDSADLVAQLYSHLADASMGLAGAADAKSTRRTEYLTKALGAVEKAFDYYSSIEDANGQCETMAKKAVIMKLSGDRILAADYAAAYVTLRKNAAVLSLGGR